MAIADIKSRFPAKTIRVYQKLISDTLPDLVPEIVPQVLESGLVTTRKDIGESSYTLTISDSGKSLCGSDATIFVPTNNSVSFPVITTIHLISEGGEFILKPSDNSVQIYQQGNVNYGSWIIPPRTIVTLCKIDTDVWYVEGHGILKF